MINIDTLINKYSKSPSLVSSYGVVNDLNELMKRYDLIEVEQFVADWYENHKNEFEFSVWNYIYTYDQQDNSDFKRWINDSSINALQILVTMHQYGYNIKKEKKYLVRMIGLDKDESYLKYNIKSDFWYLGTNEEYHNTIVKHTMKELEDNGFKEVFPSPLFEIIEVKE